VHAGVECARTTRGRAAVWIEDAAAAAAAGTAVLLFACLWSERPAAVVVDIAARVVFTEAPWPALGDALAAATADLAGLAYEPTIVTACAVTLRHLRSRCATLWPGATVDDDDVRALAADALDALDAACGHPAAMAASGGRPAPLIAAVDGLCTSIELLSNALLAPRGPTVCRPVPHVWLERASRAAAAGDGGDGAGASAGSAAAGAGDVDVPGAGAPMPWRHGTMAAALAAAPTRATWQGWLSAAMPVSAAAPVAAGEGRSSSGGGDGTTASRINVGAVCDSIARLPRDAVVLLHWLAVVAPVKLLRLPPSAVASGHGGRTEAYCLVRGPVSRLLYETAWAAHLDHGGPATGSRADTDADADAGACLGVWRTLESGVAAGAAAEHGWYTEVGGGPRGCEPDSAGATAALLLHGTSSDNAFAVLQLGLRSMSGTRLQRNGAIYGDGIYTVNDVDVALGFASATGAMWAASRVGASAPTSTAAAAGGAGGARAAADGLAALCSVSAPCDLQVVVGMYGVAAPDNRVLRNGNDVRGSRLPPASYVVVPSAAHLRPVMALVRRGGGGGDGAADGGGGDGSGSGSGGGAASASPPPQQVAPQPQPPRALIRIPVSSLIIALAVLLGALWCRSRFGTTSRW